MSKFVTSMPVDIDGLKETLPTGSHVHGVQFDDKANRVQLVWEHDDLPTGLDFPVEYSPEQLADGDLPDQVRKGAKALKKKSVPSTGRKKAAKATEPGEPAAAEQ